MGHLAAFRIRLDRGRLGLHVEDIEDRRHDVDRMVVLVPDLTCGADPRPQEMMHGSLGPLLTR
jgi:hypothetical protein